LKIVYSPLHGVGESAVCPVLEADGFQDVEVFSLHREPNGDFPNVPGHVSNPENARVFDAIIERGEEIGADLILTTDPDCDRMGAAAPSSTAAHAPWQTLTGHQLAALLTDFVLDHTPNAASKYLIKTLVTTEMVRRIGASYNVPTHGDLLVGFKWIGGMMDQQGPADFLLGMEESHGYLAGDYARDKDGALACMLMSELAAACKAAGKTVCEKLDDLYWQHGYHAERLINVSMKGSAGMTRMKELMQQFRTAPPESLAGIPVAAVRDYLNGTLASKGSQPQPLAGPTGDLVFLDLAQEGNCVAVRPSGTEPKVKFYLFTFVPAEMLADLEATKQEMETRMDQLEADIRAFAGVTD
jgi:phosphoglucomutase/phosphomannomutase